jgi:hypothetical protein
MPIVNAVLRDGKKQCAAALNSIRRLMPAGSGPAVAQTQMEREPSPYGTEHFSDTEASLLKTLQSVPEITHVGTVTWLAPNRSPAFLVLVVYGAFDGYVISPESARRTAKAKGILAKLVPNVQSDIGYVTTSEVGLDTAVQEYRERLDTQGQPYEFTAPEPLHQVVC